MVAQVLQQRKLAYNMKELCMHATGAPYAESKSMQLDDSPKVWRVLLHLPRIIYKRTIVHPESEVSGMTCLSLGSCRSPKFVQWES